MRKIIDIAPYPYLPWYSGGQKLIGQFLEYLGKETDLTVASTISNDWMLAEGYKSVSLLKRSFSRYLDITLVKRITLLIKKNKFDIIIWEHPYYWWLAKRIKKKTGIKTVIHTHNIEFQRFESYGKWWWPILKFYEKKCFRGADVLFFVSDDDRNFAISEWKIDPGKCFTVPFGIEIKEFPEDKAACRSKIAAAHQINKDEKIFLFNGLLGYKPNLDAVNAILKKINPLLLSQSKFKYKIIICGKGLPTEFTELRDYADKNIIYAGFVENIEMYFKGADLFLNPVLSGGGIKTKMVESIAFGTTVISTESGAIGIDKNVCREKLNIVKDNDWDSFANAIAEKIEDNSITPPEYYEHYYWGSIIKKIIPLLS